MMPGGRSCAASASSRAAPPSAPPPLAPPLAPPSGTAASELAGAAELAGPAGGEAAPGEAAALPLPPPLQESPRLLGARVGAPLPCESGSMGAPSDASPS
mmetsp:Transcript_11301/g.33647  ORF Transcript_11301/g.33647 Transcript_11301/m.33647 type:complete len:100 (-) Transcript_11301:1053-1352(-)